MEIKSRNKQGEHIMKWTADNLATVKAYLEAGLSYLTIAQRMKLTYDQVEKAIRRHGLKSMINPDLILPKEKNKLKKDDIEKLASAIGERLYDNYKVQKLEEPKAKYHEGKKEEISILDISDVHIGTKNQVYDSKSGKQILTYNEDIFKKELGYLQTAITDIHSLLSKSYNLRELHILFLGDIVTNDRIFPEQIFEIEKVVGLQLWDGVNYFIQFFNYLLTIYDKITVVGVVGNHGRSTPDLYDEPIENNYEYHLYRIWQKQFENNKRIKIIVPDTRRYVHKIGNWKHMIEHGDTIRGFNETAVAKQVKELHLNTGGFQMFHMGHFHQIKEIEISEQVIAKINGAWVAKDNYAWKKFKSYSIPKQWFFGCNDKRPETWSYKIDLRG